MDFLYIPVENTRLLVKDWYALKSWPYNSPHPPDRYYQHFIIHHGPHAYRHGPPIHPHRAQVKVMIFNAVACRH
jgi:hypothetical protein